MSAPGHPRMLSEAFAGRRVLITGHTGFKGSWLSLWLLELGAHVAGLAKDIPTDPSLFVALGLERRVEHHIADIADRAKIAKLIATFRPDFVFHLAAQAIVSRSYGQPLATLQTNAMGTATLLDVLREYSAPCAAVMITSDKCYENVEWVYGYRETDALGGKDIYSASKAAAEAVVHAYQHSFFPQGHPVRIATARAGNVIGGGDWATDRIVADCVRAWSRGEPVEIRSPQATRPWQHVLEPLSGYLALARALEADAGLHGEAFNFGPREGTNHRVLDLLETLASIWGYADPKSAYRITGDVPFHEARLLKLNCDKASSRLHWRATLDYESTVRMTGEWYKAHRSGADMYAYTARQLGVYVERGRALALDWTK
jgi:CDP-glucose 4,6-dehydratase